MDNLTFIHKHSNSWAVVKSSRVYLASDFRKTYVAVIRYYDPTYSPTSFIFQKETNVYRLTPEDALADAVTALEDESFVNKPL